MSKLRLRYFLPIIVVLGLAFILTRNHQALRSKPFAPTPTLAPTSVPKSATVIINLKNHKITSLNNDLSTDVSALSLLRTVTTRQNLDLQTKVYSFGTLVESIAGQKNTPQLAWIYYVNGNSADVGADAYLVQPGDTIEWKYTQPSF
jgi:hypothetical protein